MQFFKILAGILATLVTLLILTSLAARMSDGPVAIFAGGPLTSGELVEGPDPDWGFAREVPTVELQLLEPPRSRTTWILVDDGKLYIPCGYMNSTLGRIWKKWPIEAEKDGRAMLRIEGKRYPRQLVRRTEPALLRRLMQQIEDKYDVPATEMDPESGGLWIFELAPVRGQS